MTKQIKSAADLDVNDEALVALKEEAKSRGVSDVQVTNGIHAAVGDILRPLVYLPRSALAFGILNLDERANSGDHDARIGRDMLIELYNLRVKFEDMQAVEAQRKSAAEPAIG